MRKFKVRYLNSSIEKIETVYGENPEHLKQLYAMTGDDIEILEEMENDLPKENQIKPQVHDNDMSLMDFEVPNVSKPDQPTQHTYVESNNDVDSEIYYTINGNKLMMRGGVLYQKSWKDIEDTTEYRIISKKSGKTLSMEDRVIQALVWSPVDNDESDINTKELEQGEGI